MGCPVRDPARYCRSQRQVVFDGHLAVLLPSREVQWLVARPAEEYRAAVEAQESEVSELELVVDCLVGGSVLVLAVYIHRLVRVALDEYLVRHVEVGDDHRRVDVVGYRRGAHSVAGDVNCHHSAVAAIHLQWVDGGK